MSDAGRTGAATYYLARGTAGSGGLLAPSVILASQCSMVGLLTPEKRLMLAVLEDAVGCLESRKRDSVHGGERAAYNEALRWLLDDDDRWWFSFVNICAVNNLSPAAVREAVRRGQTAPIDGRHHVGHRRVLKPARIR